MWIVCRRHVTQSSWLPNNLSASTSQPLRSVPVQRAAEAMTRGCVRTCVPARQRAIVTTLTTSLRVAFTNTTDAVFFNSPFGQREQHQVNKDLMEMAVLRSKKNTHRDLRCFPHVIDSYVCRKRHRKISKPSVCFFFRLFASYLKDVLFMKWIAKSFFLTDKGWAIYLLSDLLHGEEKKNQILSQHHFGFFLNI